MALEQLKVQVIRRETIKPSSPTPHHLKTFKLSLLDQMIPDLYIPLSLFYPFSSTELPRLQEVTEIAAKRSLHLRKSLSETLTHFYPFAGRIKNNLEIECNDEGAQFIEAQVNCSISEILKQPDSETIKQFLPIETDLKQAVINGCLLVIQVSHFEDGGIALGLSVSHKITDASTLSMLINSWATTCLGSGQSLVPKFGADFLFPPLSDSTTTSSDIFAAESVEEKFTTRRFVFDAEKIALLRSKSASEIVKNPTRVEAISALIWKCAMQASRSNSGVHRPSVCFQSMNIRPRVAPPLPKNFAGNFVAGYFATNKEEDKIRESDHLQSLVTKFRKGIKEVEEKYAKRDGWKEGMQVLQEYGNLVKNGGIDNYIFTSWCRFSLYESDFGWGKPAWLCNANLVPKNTIILMDTRDGDGIEAWLTLKVEEMALFESNQELLSFAFLNPSVVWNL